MIEEFLKEKEIGSCQHLHLGQRSILRKQFYFVTANNDDIRELENRTDIVKHGKFNPDEQLMKKGPMM